MTSDRFEIPIYRNVQNFIYINSGIEKLHPDYRSTTSGETKPSTFREKNPKELSLCHKLWLPNPYIFATLSYFKLWLLLDQLV